VFSFPALFYENTAVANRGGGELVFVATIATTGIAYGCVAVSLLVGAVIYAAVTRVGGARLAFNWLVSQVRQKKAMRTIVVSSMFNMGGLLCIAYSYALDPDGAGANSSILGAQILVLSVYARLVFAQQMTNTACAGVVICVGGIFLLGFVSSTPDSQTAVVMALASMASFCVTNIGSKHAREQGLHSYMAGWMILTMMCVWSGVTLVLSKLFTGTFFVDMPDTTRREQAFLAGISGATFIMCYTYAMCEGVMAFVASISRSVPVPLVLL
jgi:hypothetical protein